MGKKMAIISILILFLRNVDIYGQVVDGDMIKWENHNSFEKKVFSDTCQIKEQYNASGFAPFCQTNYFELNDRRFYCCSHAVGFGLPIWVVQIFEGGKEWRLVLEGSIVKHAIISSKLDYLREKILFYAVGAKCDSVTKKRIIKDAELIGEVKISDL